MDSFKDNVLNSTQPRIGDQLRSVNVAVALSVFLNLTVSFPPIFWILWKGFRDDSVKSTNTKLQ